MSKTVTLRGSLSVGDGSCGGCSTDQTTKSVGLGGASGVCCESGLLYDEASVFSTAIATAGLVGAAFVDILGLNQFTAIEFLRVASSAKFRLRINPTRPALVGTAPLPAGGVVAGAATFTVTTDTGVVYTAAVAFSGATNTPALVASAISAALAAVGAPFPPGVQIATLSALNVLTVAAPGIGPAAYVELAAGAPATLALGVALVRATGTASDLPDVDGLAIFQFPRYPNAPTKIQASGVASLDIVAAGRVTA